ncbi:hypothetical protein CBS101457_000485 [Exobasidium rhododendri]|nr:hypothetical protein CBS101457_000485 [Exobasidium rhododendri]
MLARALLHEWRPPRLNVPLSVSGSSSCGQGCFFRGYARLVPARASDYIPIVYSSPLVKELVLIRDVIYKLNKTNRGVFKRSILEKEGEALADLLLFLYDPQIRLNVTSTVVLRHLARRAEENFDFPETTYSSIMPLLRELEARQVTGNAAMDRIGSFMQQLEGKEEEVKAAEKIKITLREVVMRCLDRNLKAGINDKTVQAVFGKRGSWTLAQGAIDEFGTKVKHSSEAERKDYSSSKWGVALGKPCNTNQLKHYLTAVTEEEGQKTWYMSRKLDGVRCIVKVTFDTSDEVKTPLTISTIDTLSRTGKAFSSLDVLKAELAILIRECPAIVKVLKRSISPGRQETVSLFLDGEVCALVPEKDSDDGFKEDFAEIVGAVRRQSSTLAKPAYFPFDILNEAEFLGWEEEKYHLDRDPFYVRVKRVEGFVDYCRDQGSVIVRKLVQTPIKTFEQIERASEEASSKGWEGLIFRKGDRYVGKRTSSICKYKQWQEAEYTVLETQTALMRLPVNQQYEEREGLASVTISHNGTEVLVGSGFTVEERLRYAANPGLIVGKEITVQYFSESNSASRADKNQLSLRFPRLRKVWEEGKRDV